MTGPSPGSRCGWTSPWPAYRAEHPSSKSNQRNDLDAAPSCSHWREYGRPWAEREWRVRCYFVEPELINIKELSHRMQIPQSALVLVVEDEPLVRLDAIDMLTDAGFRVIDAANADEAIAILEARPDIRVVVTDV